MSTKRSIIETLQTNLKAIDGTGDYVFDVSDANSTERVVIGRQIPPSIPPPCIYLHPVRGTTEQAPGRTALTKYDRTLQVQIIGFVDAESDEAGELVLQALDMLDDIERALESDRLVGGFARDLEVEGEVYHGHELDVGLDVGVAVCGATITYQEKSAT